tara:strand:+ start:280 stop:711 length:432 start_codon:yes stop_codon:yes gene_type:complete
MKEKNKYKWENGQVIDQKTGEIYVHEQHAYWNYRHKTKENKELVIISGFMGFAIGVFCMMFINIDKEVKQVEELDNIKHIIQENINTCEDIIEWMNEDVWNGKVDSTYYEDYIYNLEDIIEENRRLRRLINNRNCVIYQNETN